MTKASENAEAGDGAKKLVLVDFAVERRRRRLSFHSFLLLSNTSSSSTTYTPRGFITSPGDSDRGEERIGDLEIHCTGGVQVV